MYEIPSYVIGWLVIEVKYFGRRISIIFGWKYYNIKYKKFNIIIIIFRFFISGIICIFAFFIADSIKLFIFFSGISRLFFEAVFCIVYPYTSEIYPTKIRSTGLGMSVVYL